MNIEIYEDTYNIAVNQYLSRKTAGSKRRKEAFRSKKRRSRVLRDKYGFIADGKMLSKLGKSYYNGHAQCEEWRNRCVAKRKSNSCSYKTVSERRRIEMADCKMMEYIIGIDADYDPALEKYYADLLAHLDYINRHCDDVDDDWTFFA